MKTNFDARRVFAHPVWWCAAALLIANDHLFKGAEVLPSGVTGKLSDFAGLLVAPTVLAALIGVNRRWGWTGSHVLTGVVFAAINLSPLAAGAFEGLMAHTPFPWWITVDPTDLAALPALALSWLVFGGWARHPVALRPVLWRLGVGLGALASVATSPPPEPFCEDTGECQPCWDNPDPSTQCMEANWEVQSFSAVFSLQNSTNTTQVFRVRTLKPSAALDCDAVAADPSAYLHPGLFAPASVWVVDPRRGLALSTPVNNERQCIALYVDGPDTPRTLIFWQVADYPARWMLDSESNASPDDRERMIFVRGSETGATVDPHPAVFSIGREDDALIEPLCETPDEGTTLGWSDFPSGRNQQIHAISVGADGCNAIQFTSERWYFCAPGLILPFAVDDMVTFGPVASASEQSLPGFRLQGPAGSIDVGVGEETPAGAPGVPAPIEVCGHHRDSCGGAVRPLEVTFQTSDGPQTIRAGQRVDIDEATTAFVYRAQDQAVVDTDCAAGGADSAPRIESVVVTISNSEPEPEEPEEPEMAEEPEDTPEDSSDEEEME